MRGPYICLKMYKADIDLLTYHNTALINFYACLCHSTTDLQDVPFEAKKHNHKRTKKTSFSR